MSFWNSDKLTGRYTHSSLDNMTPKEFTEQSSAKFESRKSPLLAGAVFG